MPIVWGTARVTVEEGVMLAVLNPEGSWRQWSRRVYATDLPDNTPTTHTPHASSKTRSVTPDVSINPNFSDNVSAQQDSEIGMAITTDGSHDPSKTTAGQEMSVAEWPPPVLSEGKLVIQEEDCYDMLPINYPGWRKWMILCVLFLVQISMNINCSIYSNGVALIASRFDTKKHTARLGQMLYLVAYAFGSELWAPWSEELGRYPIMQLSLSLMNIWQLMCTCAGNLATILVGRFFGGLSSAGGSVTLGVVADMWDPDSQHYAVAMIVLSSVIGSVFGPVVGGFMEMHLNWRWNFGVQLIVGLIAQIIHASLVPETRSTILLNHEAKRRRKTGLQDIYGPKEVNPSKITVTGVLKVWARPFKMFIMEPIVLCLSLLSGFSDALIFLFLESFTYVYAQWHFTIPQRGLVFIAIIIGNIIGFLSFLPTIRQHLKWQHTNPSRLTPESRLWWLLFTAPLEVIGLFGFAWTSLGPPIPWIAPTLFAGLIAIANYCIYMATIDYMVASYGEYSASATGGNAFARNLLAGIAALYATPLYTKIPGRFKLEWPSTILGFVSIFVTIPIYIFYWKGPEIRRRSKFACSVEQDRRVKYDRRMMTQGRSSNSALQSMRSGVGRASGADSEPKPESR